MTSTSLARYGVYFAPTGELWARARAWLGRDAKTGRVVRPHRLPALREDERLALTESPRHYGLHATLKPPFHLAAPYAEGDLFSALVQLAARHAPTVLPALEVATLDNFVALRFRQPATAIGALVDDCVRALDHLRAPPGEAELSRRRAQGLSVRRKITRSISHLGMRDRWYSSTRRGTSVVRCSRVQARDRRFADPWDKCPHRYGS